MPILSVDPADIKITIDGKVATTTSNSLTINGFSSAGTTIPPNTPLTPIPVTITEHTNDDCFICRKCLGPSANEGWFVLTVEISNMPASLKDHSVVVDNSLWLYFCHECWNHATDNSQKHCHTFDEWIKFSGSEWEPVFEVDAYDESGYKIITAKKHVKNYAKIVETIAKPEELERTKK